MLAAGDADIRDPCALAERPCERRGPRGTGDPVVGAVDEEDALPVEIGRDVGRVHPRRQRDHTVRAPRGQQRRPTAERAG